LLRHGHLNLSPERSSQVTNTMISLPRFYPILDASCFACTEALLGAAEQLVNAGVQILQYRNKSGDAALILIEARELRQCVLSWPGGEAVRLIMNDRADICLAAEFDGLHVGQDDLSPESARRIIGPDRWLGVSTHNVEQVVAAETTSAHYVAIGPVFGTTSKANPDPVVGLAGVRDARRLTTKPLVAIGGITRANCRSVLDSGADSVAVISDLVADPSDAAEEFIRLLA
jgi:thiamine-phosphate pyrophosphorylase